jgi:hypothetical protein
MEPGDRKTVYRPTYYDVRTIINLLHEVEDVLKQLVEIMPSKEHTARYCVIDDKELLVSLNQEIFLHRLATGNWYHVGRYLSLEPEGEPPPATTKPQLSVVK